MTRGNDMKSKFQRPEIKVCVLTDGSAAPTATGSPAAVAETAGLHGRTWLLPGPSQRSCATPAPGHCRPGVPPVTPNLPGTRAHPSPTRTQRAGELEVDPSLPLLPQQHRGHPAPSPSLLPQNQRCCPHSCHFVSATLLVPPTPSSRPLPPAHSNCEETLQPLPHPALARAGPATCTPFPLLSIHPVGLSSCSTGLGASPAALKVPLPLLKPCAQPATRTLALWTHKPLRA